MKLSALFARYLYQRKKLSLPGIGIFSIDQSVTIPEPADKLFSDFLQQIKYEQKPIIQADEDLISFIRTETGKIKPLAESDLDSFLSDGKILLNIGKPFHIDGIGSLMKTKTGLLEFTPGEPSLPKMEGFFNANYKEDAARKRITYGEDHTQNNYSKQLLVACGLIGGLILVIWGGYALYNRTNSSTSPMEQSGTAAISPPDPSRSAILLDSVKKIIESSSPQSTIASGYYKFIIERTANKKRAVKRFNQLKDNRTDIKMESADSTLFTLYITIPALPSDTARIRDSLKNWYGSRRVSVEK